MSQHELGQVTGGDAEEHSFSLSEHIWTVKEAGVGVERRRWESKGSLRPTAPSGVLQVHYSALHSFFYFNTCVRGKSGSKKKVKKNSNIFGLITKINGGEVIFFYSKLTIFYTLKEDNKIPQKDSRETWCINKVQTIRRPTLEVNDFISSGISPFITNII